MLPEAIILNGDFVSMTPADITCTKAFVKAWLQSVDNQLKRKDRLLMKVEELAEQRAQLKPVENPELDVGEAEFGGSDPEAEKPGRSPKKTPSFQSTPTKKRDAKAALKKTVRFFADSWTQTHPTNEVPALGKKEYEDWTREM